MGAPQEVGGGYGEPTNEQQALFKRLLCESGLTVKNAALIAGYNRSHATALAKERRWPMNSKVRVDGHMMRTIKPKYQAGILSIEEVAETMDQSMTRARFLMDEVDPASSPLFI